MQKRISLNAGGSKTRRPASLHIGGLCVSLVLACTRGVPEEQAPAPKRAEAGAQAALESRPEVVIRADQLALSGSKKSGKEGEALTLEAARLRERLFRFEAREADALEALELYASVARADSPDACTAAVAGALLGAELRKDPGALYEELYLRKSRHAGTPCAAEAESALIVLEAYRPSSKTLAKLDEKLGTKPEGTVVVQNDERGFAVTPKFFPEAKRDVQITRVERYGSPDSARIVAFLEHPALFRVGSLAAEGARGPRLYVDIDHAKYQGKSEYPVGGVVERVRLGQKEDGTRLVLDLTESVFHKVFYVPEPFRLVIDVSKQPPSARAPRDGGAARAVRRVVLDPGHGGHDSGAVGASGLREKDVTLDIAHRAAPIIARELGIATLLTRDADTFVPLDERTARANNFNADLFVSIHCNASDDGHGSGVMTFVLDSSRDALAARVAARENASSAAAAAELATVMSHVLDPDARLWSLRFAELLQRSALVSLGTSYSNVSDHGVKKAGFYVLAGAEMPAVLFEASFISHPREEQRLNTGDYRQRIADAIANAVRAYRKGL